MVAYVLHQNIYPSKILKEDNKQINIFIKYVEEVRKNKKCLLAIWSVFVIIWMNSFYIWNKEKEFAERKISYFVRNYSPSSLIKKIVLLNSLFKCFQFCLSWIKNIFLIFYMNSYMQTSQGKVLSAWISSILFAKLNALNPL